MNADDVIKMFEGANMIARHGDVVLVKINQKQAPKHQEIKQNWIAEGEATGHAHRVSKATIARVQDSVDQFITKVTSKTNVTHEEHADGPLAKGTYISGIQKQYSPNGWTRVVD